MNQIKKIQTVTCVKVVMGVVLKGKEKADLFMHSNCGSQTFPRQLWKGLKRLGFRSLSLSLCLCFCSLSNSVALICARMRATSPLPSVEVQKSKTLK